MNFTTHRGIVGVGVLDDPHIFNAGKRLPPKLFAIHDSFPCMAVIPSANGTFC